MRAQTTIETMERARAARITGLGGGIVTCVQFCPKRSSGCSR